MPLTSAGARNCLVRFEAPTKEAEAAGGERITGWTLVERAYAKVLFGTSQERREAGSTNASQIATLRVLATTQLRTVDQECRAVFDGGNWNISAFTLVGTNRSELEFTAVLARG